MKRFVRGDAVEVATITVATLAVVAITGAGAGATYLIAVGFLAIAIFRWRLQESPRKP
jgi:Mg2+/citrate symporter